MTYEDEAKILTKAFIRMIAFLQLNKREVSAIIGLSGITMSDLFTAQKNYLCPHSNEGHVAILLIRLFRSLDNLFAGNAEQCRLWLRSQNKHLEANPIELIMTVEGLVRCLQYLDAIQSEKSTVKNVNY
jgi:hypothetical protein